MQGFLNTLDDKMSLEHFFKKFVMHFDNDRTYAEELWQELEKAYSQKGRHYHTLDHLTNMIQETMLVLDFLEAPFELCCSIFYHDIVYNVKRQDNEDKSADLGMERALDMGLGLEGAKLCYAQIMATKSHDLSDNMDTNYLTDIDLSVLGASSQVYEEYTAAIRKEYSIYPGFLYRRGRKKVLKHFLGMDHIYKTEYFQQKYEKQARINLGTELAAM
jgi:predicted metal-dependent HD superfamily phosphohydrolase